MMMMMMRIIEDEVSRASCTPSTPRRELSARERDSHLSGRESRYNRRSCYRTRKRMFRDIRVIRAVPYYTRRIPQHPAFVRILFTPFPLLPFLFPTGQIAAANAISAPIGAPSSSPNTVDD